MGLKSYRLWVMGQLYSNVQSPATSRRPPHHRAIRRRLRAFAASSSSGAL
jgi:hypothetical protein